MKLTVEDIKKIKLLPGETLVIRYNMDLITNKFIKSFKEKIKEVFPNNKFIIIPNSVEIYKVITEE